jgi:hypothetical protein
MEYVIRYDVKPNRNAEFREWLGANDSVMREHSPEGWTYRGTYFTVRGFGEYSNETRWEIADYAALGSGFGDAENIRITQEWLDFVDQARQFQATLYKDATEVDILTGT